MTLQNKYTRNKSVRSVGYDGEFVNDNERNDQYK